MLLQTVLWSSWWDYGDWLSDIGNVTTLCDNTTYNATQIGNVGLIMMGNENQSMMMLNHYENYDNPGRVNYVVVFMVLAIQQSQRRQHNLRSVPRRIRRRRQIRVDGKNLRNLRANVHQRRLHGHKQRINRVER